MPRSARATSDNPAVAVAPIVADTQSKPPGVDGSSASGADATVVPQSRPQAPRRTAYPSPADAAIEDGGGGTWDVSHVAAGEAGSAAIAYVAGAAIVAATAMPASAAASPVLRSVERISTPF
jgi:hypothetical protein